MKVTLFDYGAGNIHSLAKALSAPGISVDVEEDAARAVDTDVLVLPGVGAFPSAAERLAKGREAMREAIVDRKLPCLGICLGMQLFFSRSEEGPGEGLGLLPGEVKKLSSARVPHMGWNQLSKRADALLEKSKLETAYFAHSYVCRVGSPEPVVAWTTHEGDTFAAAVRVGSAVGVQFHPEKSSSLGLQFIRCFLEEAKR
jgi:glutamine amidotransferase